MSSSLIYLELHVPDFTPVRSFYTSLGFQEVRSESNYLVMAFGSAIINFYGGSDQIYQHAYFADRAKTSRPGTGVEIIVFVEDVVTYYQKIKNKISIVTPLQERPWGAQDFRIADPFGYYLRFSQPYKLLS